MAGQFNKDNTAMDSLFNMFIEVISLQTYSSLPRRNAFMYKGLNKFRNSLKSSINLMNIVIKNKVKKACNRPST
jgi:hypothetical protein